MGSQFLIGAVHSGSGKTILTLGLLKALRNRGLVVQSFKSGPDYIDTKFHERASGNKTINLDLFLASANHVQETYRKHASPCDVAITEGVMGLFDGYEKMEGSSAQLARMLDIPVILVVNAKSMAYSVAPLMYGFMNFRKDVHVAGVIFNWVGSDSHYAFLKEACDDVGLAPLGYLPKNKKLEIPSRHLGLKIDLETPFDIFADHAAALVEEHVDLDGLLTLTRKENRPFLANNTGRKAISREGDSFIQSAVAFDEAFNFMYHENIEYLKQRGTVAFFSPIHDKKLPDADFVYLPGGYPELYLKPLSDNTGMKDSIRRYVEQGGRLLAECGGMLYLSSSMTDENGKEYPMLSIFNQKATMQNAKLTLGYRKFEYNGVKMKGHEFHYSSLESNLESITKQYSAASKPVDTKLLRYKNAIAGYTHLYWAETDNLMDLFQQR